jgi:hypothetical protein
MKTEIKNCRCGYPIMAYLEVIDDRGPEVIKYIDGLSGNYEETLVCPGCKDGLEYTMLEN